MESLTLRHLRPLHWFIRDLYRPRNLESFRNYLLSNVPRLIPLEMISLVEVNIPARQSRYWVMPMPEQSPAQDRTWRRLMLEHPVITHRRRTGDSQALKISDFASRTQLHKLELYQQHYRSYGVESHMGLALSTMRTSPIRLIGLGRGPLDFSESERLLLNLLRPHLVQASENARAVARFSGDCRLVGASPEPAGGVIVLAQDGRVRIATQQAREWITEYFRRAPLAASRLPEDLQRWVVHQQAVLARTDQVPPPLEPLLVEGGAGRLIIRLLSDADQRILLLTEQPTEARGPSFEAFGLTQREAEVLTWVAEGKTNAEVGMILGARPRTVAKHVERIFEKLGVETRTAAARRALKLGIEIGSAQSVR